MSLKIRLFAGKWRDVITLSVLTITCVTFVWGMGRWTEKQDGINLSQDKSIAYVMYKDSVIINLIDKITTNQNDMGRVLNALVDRMDTWEPEHITLLKEHNLYPQKLYRGEMRHVPSIKP